LECLAHLAWTLLFAASTTRSFDPFVATAAADTATLAATFIAFVFAGISFLDFGGDGDNVDGSDIDESGRGTGGGVM
jgi:hypothetical protein